MVNFGEVSFFVEKQIEKLDKENPYSRAMLAKLRRGVGKSPGAIPELWAITLNGMPSKWFEQSGNSNGKPSIIEWSVHTALTLYALHRQGKEHSMSYGGIDAETKNLYGNSFGKAVARLRDGNNDEAIKRRFDAVTTANDFSELSHHARGMVQLLKAKDITLDYPRFAKELCFLQLPNKAEEIRLQWGEDFYGQWGTDSEGGQQ